jgi:hypothetical protein
LLPKDERAGTKIAGRKLSARVLFRKGLRQSESGGRFALPTVILLDIALILKYCIREANCSPGILCRKYCGLLVVSEDTNKYFWASGEFP